MAALWQFDHGGRSTSVNARAFPSDQPGPLHRVVSVDQLDAEAIGLSVDHQRIAGREPAEGVAARLLVEVGAGDVDRRVAAGKRLRARLSGDDRSPERLAPR